MEAGKPIVVTYATKYGPRHFCGFVAKVDLVTHRIKMVNGDEIE
ncbi:hypothetical protein GCM10011571_35690 [Marinithermofilum abyssi]|uniref:Uncharacterized protein n=2 Tax=Marinithermofilum abyssi TaxID=1571185 RepID=A0A8J2YFL4_9BACL|nr:hypothetical protein GCM10011571_35690 [Marinithermofilum abyssi]